MADLKLTKREKVYSVDDGQKRGPLTMARLRFHPNGRHLLGQCVDRRLALWDLQAEPEKVKKGLFVMGRLVCPHELGWIRGLDVHPRGEWIATGGSDRRLKLWKWAEGPAESPTHDLAGHEGWIEAVAFSPDGERVATVGTDRQLKLWSVTEGKLIKAVPAHSAYIRDVAFTPDGGQIVTGGEDGQAIVWAAESLEAIRTLDTLATSDQQGQTPALGGILRLGVSHDSRWVALGIDRQAEVLELATGRSAGWLNQAGVEALFGRRSLLLAAGSDTVKVVSLDAAKLSPKEIEIKTDAKGKKSRANPAALPGRAVGEIKRGEHSLGAAFSADDKLLAVGKTDGTAELWEVT